jgi:hypothetical protein
MNRSVWEGGSMAGQPGVLENNILVLQALHMMNQSVWEGGSMAGQPGVLENNILVLQALHMMNRSVCGGGSMAGQPGALENVKYMTSMEFQNSRLPTAGQDIGNRNKVSKRRIAYK